MNFFRSQFQWSFLTYKYYLKLAVIIVHDLYYGAHNLFFRLYTFIAACFQLPMSIEGYIHLLEQSLCKCTAVWESFEKSVSIISFRILSVQSVEMNLLYRVSCPYTWKNIVKNWQAIGPTAASLAKRNLKLPHS